MEVITMESRVFKDLVERIEKVSDLVAKCEYGAKPQNDEKIWPDSQEVSVLLLISTRTRQRLRKKNLINYLIIELRVFRPVVLRMPSNKRSTESHFIIITF